MGIFRGKMEAVIGTVVLALVLASCGGGGNEFADASIDAGLDAGSGTDAGEERSTRLEQYRPQYHYTPLKNWMNDPNGLVYYKGKYHLFYQYAPDGFLTSQIHWGHAVSTDLAHWTDLPVALYPDTELGNVYSGSAVVDSGNTSGLCSGTSEPDGSCLVAIFTHSGGTSGGQKQSLAFSHDRGRTWKMYGGNPVLKPDAGQKDFRDPKVFRHDETGRWVMVLAAGDRINIYTSADLRAWSFSSDFIRDPGDPTGTWECPDLFRLPVEGGTGGEKWVLVVSVFSGGPQGGSGVRTFIGNFDGTRFISETDTAVPQWLDHGKDFYAWQSWYGMPDGSRTGIAWMNNWSYALTIPTKPWQGAMTVARELFLERIAGSGLVVVQRPSNAVGALRGETLYELGGEIVSGIRELPAEACADGLEVTLVMRIGPAVRAGIGVESAGVRQFSAWCSTVEKMCFLERGEPALAGMPDGFAGVHGARVDLAGGAFSLRLLLDRSSAEAFFNGGTAAVTGLLFPAAPDRRLVLFSEGGEAAVEGMTVVRLLPGL
jgi:fructan beta-fructosidase